MIAWLTGTVKDQFEDRIILDQNGIGYEIQLPARIASSVQPGEKREMYIYTYVREDALSLFGFSSWSERELFLQLIKVSGVGAKTALVMLSQLEPSAIIQAIVQKNVSLLQSVKGIGKKAAEKIVVELSDRMSNFQSLSVAGEAAPPSEQEDLISALMNLGYKRPAVEHALSKIDLPEPFNFDFVLKESLKVLGSS